ncbi:MAG: putative hexose phosphate transport protein [Chlamydiales bacterium]|jgi:OPA family sugar phosphate sensor protein UhpC-like MFS transporter|nr:putative hexose phosphate transport protein [Chlamydiales bacterium]
MFSFFKAPPAIKEIEDPATIDKEYKYWRMRIFYSIYIGYTFFYFSRTSYANTKPALGAALEYSNSELGIITSAFAMSYGISKFVSGILSDRSNVRYFMAFGLIMAGIANILFGMSSSITMFALLWGLNGWFQGFGWPPVAKTLTQWYSKSERGRWWSFLNTSHNMGALFTPIILSAIITYASSRGFEGWRFGMYFPGMMSILMGIFLINRLRDVPQTLGLPPIEKYRNDYPDQKVTSDKDDQPSVRKILVQYILSNPYMWILGLSYLFVYMIRSGTTEWIPKYLMETKGYTLPAASTAITSFELGGLTGNLTAGWISDKIFRGKRAPVNVLFSLSAMSAVILLAFLPNLMTDTPWLNYFVIALTGFCVFGPQMLIGVAAAEACHKKAAGTATGFISIFAYSGVFLTGYPLGVLIDHYGWNGLFIALASAGGIAALLLMTMLSTRTKTNN